LTVTFASLACTTGPVVVSHDVPQVGVGLGFDNNDKVQSETAIGVAHAFVFTDVVAFYNDFSVSTTDPLFDGTTWKRGYSILGWSTSFNYGQAWEYRGQVSPPPGWAMIGADPSVSVDPVSTNIVYATSLGVSDAAWATISTDNLTTTTYPLTVADSFCVATSIDAGQTFPTDNVHCRVVSDIPTANHTVDRTAAAIDGFGRVWVAVADVPGDLASSGVIRLFHNEPASPGNFIEVPVPLVSGSNVVRHQVLRSDAHGNIWLAAMGLSNNLPTSAEHGLHIFKFDIIANTFTKTVAPDAGCGRIVSLGQQVNYNSTHAVRNAHSYDFDFGLSEPPPFGGGGKEVVRFVWELTANDGTGRQYVEVAEADAEFTGTCRVDQSLGSTIADSGNQFMPSINYTNRDGSPNWWIVYLTNAGVVDTTGPFAKPEADQVTTTSHVAPQITLRTELVPADWSVCTDFAHDNYWGDYFGLAQFKDVTNRWWGISAFSDSRPGPGACVGDRPQHVAASRW